MIRNTLSASIVALLAIPANGQETNDEIDCTDPQNAELEICLNLPSNKGELPITNLAPLLPAAAAALGAGIVFGGGNNSTPSTN